MNADEHLRTALRHAPDRDLEAPRELSAQIVAAAYRAAAEPAPHTVPRRWPWPAWRGARPLRLGASGALASVLLAGVIGLMWQANPPGPGRGTDAGDGPSPAATPATASTPQPARAQTPEQLAVQERSTAVAPLVGTPGPVAGGRAGMAQQATEQRAVAPAAVRRAATEVPTQAQALPPAAPPSPSPSPSLAPAPALPSPLPPAVSVAASPAPAPVPTPPQSTGHEAVADAAPEATTPAPATAAAADSHMAAPLPRPLASRLAAAAPAALRAPPTSLATVAPPWAEVEDLSPSWRVQGLATEVDREWLAQLARFTQGRWAPAPEPASQPASGNAEPDLVWLQGDKPVGRLWLGPARATWCSARAACQSAPLPEATIAALKDSLQKKLPR